MLDKFLKNSYKVDTIFPWYMLCKLGGECTNSLTDIEVFPWVSDFIKSPRFG